MAVEHVTTVESRAGGVAYPPVRPAGGALDMRSARRVVRRPQLQSNSDHKPLLIDRRSACRPLFSKSVQRSRPCGEPSPSPIRFCAAAAKRRRTPETRRSGGPEEVR